MEEFGRFCAAPAIPSAESNRVCFLRIPASCRTTNRKQCILSDTLKVGWGIPESDEYNEEIVAGRVACWQTWEWPGEEQQDECEEVEGVWHRECTLNLWSGECEIFLGWDSIPLVVEFWPPDGALIPNKSSSICCQKYVNYLRILDLLTDKKNTVIEEWKSSFYSFRN